MRERDIYHLKIILLIFSFSYTKLHTTKLGSDVRGKGGGGRGGGQ